MRARWNDRAVAPHVHHRWSGPSGSGPYPRHAGRRSGRPMHGPRDIDASLYVLALCRQLQMTVLDPRGIDCMIDVEGVGRLPISACRFLGRVVTALVTTAGASAKLGTSASAVIVSLRRRGTTCLCTVGCRGLGDLCAATSGSLARISQLAEGLKTRCAVRLMPEGNMVAVMFDAASADRAASETLWQERADKASHLARRPHPFQQEDLP